METAGKFRGSWRWGRTEVLMPARKTAGAALEAALEAYIAPVAIVQDTKGANGKLPIKCNEVEVVNKKCCTVLRWVWRGSVLGKERGDEKALTKEVEGGRSRTVYGFSRSVQARRRAGAIQSLACHDCMTAF